MPNFKEELEEIFRDQQIQFECDKDLMDFIMSDDYLVREGDDLLIQNMMEELERENNG